MEFLDEIIRELEQIIERENRQREELGTPQIAQTQIQIVGQTSLLMSRS